MKPIDEVHARRRRILEQLGKLHDEEAILQLRCLHPGWVDYNPTITHWGLSRAASALECNTCGLRVLAALKEERWDLYPSPPMPKLEKALSRAFAEIEPKLRCPTCKRWHEDASVTGPWIPAELVNKYYGQE